MNISMEWNESLLRGRACSVTIPLAINRATDLCPALPETFLSIQVVFLSPWFRRFWSEETITESDHDHKSHFSSNCDQIYLFQHSKYWISAVFGNSIKQVLLKHAHLVRFTFSICWQKMHRISPVQSAIANTYYIFCSHENVYECR